MLSDIFWIVNLSPLARPPENPGSPAGVFSLVESVTRGGHHHIARPAYVDRAEWPSGVRTGSDPRPHRRRPGAGRGARRQNGAAAEAHAAPAERAIKRRDQGEETLADIGRSYNVSAATISRLAA